MPCAQLLLKTHKKIEGLPARFQYLDIGDEGVPQLIKLMNEEPRLGCIYASFNKITMAGAQLLADAFAANTTLEFLDVDHNPWQSYEEERGKQGEALTRSSHQESVHQLQQVFERSKNKRIKDNAKG